MNEHKTQPQCIANTETDKPRDAKPTAETTDAHNSKTASTTQTIPETEEKAGKQLKSVKCTFLRGNGEDYRAMNAIWKKVHETFKSYKYLLANEYERGCMIIPQRIFVLLCREYLRIRAEPRRERDISIDEFLSLGDHFIHNLCRVKAQHFRQFQERKQRGIHQCYQQQMEQHNENVSKRKQQVEVKSKAKAKAKAKYQYDFTKHLNLS